MDFEKNTPVSGDCVESEADKQQQSEGEMAARSASWWQRLCKKLPVIAIVARYCLPCVSVLVFLVMGWFYNVQASSIGSFYRVSTWRLLFHTLTGTHAYLGGEMASAKSWFYGLLSVSAILCILVFLLAVFFSVLAAYTAIRAFLAGHESEESNRMKIAFKIAFPNRVCLYLSNLLILIPAAYPHIYSAISARFLLIGGENAIFVFSNPTLVVLGVLAVVTVLLALFIPRFERRKRMNMFLVWHDEHERNEESSSPD